MTGTATLRGVDIFFEIKRAEPATTTRASAVATILKFQIYATPLPNIPSASIAKKARGRNTYLFTP